MDLARGAIVGAKERSHGWSQWWEESIFPCGIRSSTHNDDRDNESYEISWLTFKLKVEELAENINTCVERQFCVSKKLVCRWLNWIHILKTLKLRYHIRCHPDQCKTNQPY